MGLTRRDLAARTGISESYIYKLLGTGAGSRENPRQYVKEQIAAVLGISALEMAGDVTLPDFLLERLHDLDGEQLEQLQSGNVSARIATAVQIMQTHPKWETREQVAEALALPPDTLDVLLSGTPPSDVVLKQMADRTGLSARWWLRGRLDPLPGAVAQMLAHDDAHAYVSVVNKAISQGLSANMLLNLVEAIGKGRA
jgi:transcriptional regulator with XRE-family HTH domain